VRLFLLLSGLATCLAAQGAIKFDYQGRYDTVLTSADTVLLKMTLLEFHRKLARAGYASYFWRDPTVLAKYADVQAESIRLVSDTERLTILGEIAAELKLVSDTAILGRIGLRSIRFLSDTVARIVALTPFASGETSAEERTGETYELHRFSPERQWWVFSTGQDTERIVYRNYLNLPDEDVNGIFR